MAAHTHTHTYSFVGGWINKRKSEGEKNKCILSILVYFTSCLGSGHEYCFFFNSLQVVRLTQEGVRLPKVPDMPEWLYKLVGDCRHPDKEERPKISDVIIQLKRR